MNRENFAMIRRGLVSEKVMDFTTKKQLPPLKTLPQWQRVGTMDKSRYPKQFIKDKNMEMSETKTSPDGDDAIGVDLSGMNPVQHISHLERSIAFIRTQHRDVLHSLHTEIDTLKKQNKDMNLKIIMTKNPSENGERGTRRDGGGDTALDHAQQSDGKAWSEHTTTSAHTKFTEDKKTVDDVKMVFLEDEIKQLKHSMRESNTRHHYTTQALEKSEENRRHLHMIVDTLQQQQQQAAMNNGFTMDQIPPEMRPDGVNDMSNRPPTLAECEVIIRHLRKLNEKQSHELVTLKSDLRDVLYSHKWTPDAYLLAKAYVAADDAKANNILPHIAPPRKMPPDIAFVQQDTVNLPALKQTVGNKSIDSRKRSKILQKARMNKDLIRPINISPTN